VTVIDWKLQAKLLGICLLAVAVGLVVGLIACTFPLPAIAWAAYKAAQATAEPLKEKVLYGGS